MSSDSHQFDLRLLWRRKLTILSCCVIAVGAGVGYLIVVPPIYQAQARVRIEPQGISPELDDSERIHPEFLPTQAETIRSPITISRALESVEITRPADADPATFDPVRHVLKSLQATPILNANVLTISYQSTDPEEAVELISALIESYESDVIASDKGTWSTNVQVIAERESELRDDLEAIQKKYAEHRRSSPLVADGRDGTALATAHLNQLASHLGETQKRRLELEARLQSLSAAIAKVVAGGKFETVSTAVGEAQQVALTRDTATLEAAIMDQVVHHSDPDMARSIEEASDKLRFARLQRDQYDAVYGEKHPDLIAARLEVAEYEALLSQRLQNVEGAWKGELAALETAERQLEEDYKAEHEQVKALDSYLVQDQMLQANMQKIEDLHSATLADLMSIQSADKALNEGRHSISVRVLDAPELVDDMAWPKPKLLLAASALLGLLVGCGTVFLQSQSSANPSS